MDPSLPITPASCFRNCHVSAPRAFSDATEKRLCSDQTDICHLPAERATVVYRGSVGGCFFKLVVRKNNKRRAGKGEPTAVVRYLISTAGSA